MREKFLYVIFLNLHKVYDSLDRSRCLEILEGYGVGPRSRRLLQTYCRRFRMVARAGGYYSTAFQGVRGVTQGDPLSPTIFNVVVEMVVRHRVTVMVEGAEERGERGQEGRNQASLFCTDDGMVASSDTRWLQGAFNTLVGLFYRMGMWTNVEKTVSMVCRSCQAERNQSEAVYRIQITGVGPTYRE